MRLQKQSVSGTVDGTPGLKTKTFEMHEDRDDFKVKIVALLAFLPFVILVVLDWYILFEMSSPDFWLAQYV